MKNVYLINASPRKQGSSAAMLTSFADGVRDVIPSEKDCLLHRIALYDFCYQGCRECFLCRRKDSPYYGHCGYPDSIRDLLDAIAHSDGIAIAAPIYFHNIPGELRSFLERLLYPFISYPVGGRTCLAPKAIPVTMIYTMNVTEREMRAKQYRVYLESVENWLRFVFRIEPEIVYAFNTYQFADYEKYEAGAWDLAFKTLWKDTQFPADRRMAFAAGQRMGKRNQQQL